MIGKRKFLLMAVLCVCLDFAYSALSVPSIHDVQYTTDMSGDSPYANQTIDCAGGIVINKWVGGKTKLTIYDPANSDGWGGIIVKTFGDGFSGIQVGDWVSLSGVTVEEYNGNTQLTFEATSGISVVSSGNVLPTGVVITDNVFSEQYESMRVVLNDVQITAMDLGRKDDNYNLQNVNGNYLAGDYMNTGMVFEPYHSLVSVGAAFDSISGIIEHMEKDGWDYYQLLTTETADFVVPEPMSAMLLLAGVAFLRKSK